MADMTVPNARVGDVVVVRASAMAAGGDAIARPDGGGRVVFVSGALPGELVRVQLTAAKKDFARGTVVSVVEASPARRAEPCPLVARGCAGCGWQHIEPAEQRSLKIAIARDALARIGKLPSAVVVGAPGPQPAVERYRTTARVGVTSDGRVGFRQARSNDVVPVDDCMVLHPRLSELMAGLRAAGGDVTLRVGARTGDRLADGDGMWGLPSDVRVGPSASVDEIVHGVRLRASARSFFQSSPEAAEAIVTSVRTLMGSLADDDSPLADLYGGVGLFAATLGAARPVTLVELSPSSVNDAEHNLREHRHATVLRCDVGRWRAIPHRVVIADPARAGLDRDGVAAVAATGCERLVLVNCDPAALGRDARLLVEAGFVHIESHVLDPFAQTPHVEVVSRFDRAG